MLIVLDLEKCAEIYSSADGLTEQEARQRQKIFGENCIVIEVKKIWRFALDEVSR